MASNPFTPSETENQNGSAKVDLHAVTESNASQDSPVQSNGTVATERQMWQIFTDENGEVQRKSTPVRAIIENPIDKKQQDVAFDASNSFESDQNLPNGFANPHAIDITGLGNTEDSDVMPPPKPKRAIVTNKPQKASTQVQIGGDVVVFEKDQTYTRFDNVDDNSDIDDHELNTNMESIGLTGSKTLIRSDSDLMLPYIQGQSRNPFRRLCQCWHRRHFVFRALVIALTMISAYLLIVLTIVAALK